MAGQFQREQRQQVVDRTDGGGAGIAGSGDHGGYIEGNQLGHGEQQPGDIDLGAGRQVGKVEQCSAARMVTVAGTALGGRADR